MFKIIETNKQNLENSSNTFICDDIYRILLKTGKYINAKDIIYLNIIILFKINIIWNKLRKFNKKNLAILHYVAINNSKDIGEVLISKGANINAKNIIYLNLIILFLINAILNELK